VLCINICMNTHRCMRPVLCTYVAVLLLHTNTVFQYHNLFSIISKSFEGKLKEMQVLEQGQLLMCQNKSHQGAS